MLGIGNLLGVREVRTSVKMFGTGALLEILGAGASLEMLGIRVLLDSKSRNAGDGEII